uniref:Ig-like domain-containing protein n=1 Tax=Lates calcarifer TaxID=8187 RepID=A0A4W6FCH7_LATCA
MDHRVAKCRGMFHFLHFNLIQTTKVSQQISLTVVELGENITLHCPVPEKEDKFYWYKQSLGHMAQTVAAVIVKQITITEQFKDPRFTVKKEEAQYLLTIRNVSKEDEATYFCQTGTTYSLTSGSGTFLAVNGKIFFHIYYIFALVNDQYIFKSDNPMTLQCSLLSKNKETRVQCPGEHSVHWFRAGSGGSHPGIIYTQRNRSDEEEERSCVYSLSKTIQDSSDSGTYYCAVVTCGEILFGEGTKVETSTYLHLTKICKCKKISVFWSVVFFKFKNMI